MSNCEIWSQRMSANLILNATFCSVLKQKIEAKNEKGL
jgi:hypothetical protein